MIQVTDQYYIDVSVNPVVYTVKKKIVRRNKRDGGEYEDFSVLGYLGTVGGALKFIDEHLTATTLSQFSGQLSDAITRISDGREQLWRAIDAAFPEGRVNE